MGRISFNFFFFVDFIFISKDIGGQERFGNMTGVYYRDAVGCIVVYDLSRPTTFEGVSKWKTDLDNRVQLPDGNRLPCILLANKVFTIRNKNIFVCTSEYFSAIWLKIVWLMMLNE
jgi:GTPase SAR1 family protein